MIEFPIRSLMDEQACYNYLLEVLHPEGLHCPQGHVLPDDQAPHDKRRAPIVDYRCRTCGAVFNIFTNTIWSKSRYSCAIIVLILRGIAQGVPTAHLAKELGVDNHMFFEGFVSETDLPKYYRAADVLSCTSLREGYPLVCLEAMACGTPVVATNLGTIREIVDDTGILIGEKDHTSLAKGIISLLKDSSLRKKLGARAAKRVKENFTWDRIAEKAIRIYREAMELRKLGR